MGASSYDHKTMDPEQIVLDLCFLESKANAQAQYIKRLKAIHHKARALLRATDSETLPEACERILRDPTSSGPDRPLEDVATWRSKRDVDVTKKEI